MAIYLRNELLSPTVADTEGSTATGAPSKKSETYYVRSVCVLTQRDWEQKKRKKGEWL